MRRAYRLTKVFVMAEAAKYSRRTDFKKADPSAYRHAVKHKYTAELPIPTQVKWTLALLKKEAAKYNARKKFALGASGAWDAATRMGVMDDVCAHMTGGRTVNGFWTKERCAAEALKFAHRTEWRNSPASYTAYQTANRRGWLDWCCAHMGDRRGTDNDTVYVWKAPGEYYNGKPVYKLGITSERLGEQRIRQVNSGAEIVILQAVTGKATDHEKILHILGDDPKYVTGDGRTEFRALSDSELNEAIQYIQEVAA